MKARMKRILAGVLACTMIVNLVPMDAWAASTEIVLEDQSDSGATEAFAEGGSLEAEESEVTDKEAEAAETKEKASETECAEEADMEQSLVEAYTSDEVALENDSDEEVIAGLTEETEVEETDPAYFKYSIMDGTVTITGYTGSETDVVIPKEIAGYPVTAIGNRAFADKSILISVKMPEGVTSIGDYAFHRCSNLSGELIIPDSVTSIGESAFHGCSNLSGKLIIPDSVTNIGNLAFCGCKGFNGSLVISSSVTSIGNHAFYECSNLSGELIIPDSVTSIGNYAFCICSSLSGNLTIPDSVTSIGDYAFSGCRNLSGELIIPNSVTNIGEGAFFNCSGFDGTLTLSENITKISGTTFGGCNGLKGILIIPDSVTKIEGRAFENCTGLTEIVIGRGVTSLYVDSSASSSTFYGCLNVESMTFLGLTVPDIYRTIDESIAVYRFFSSMENLKTIEVPEESYSEYVSAYGIGIKSTNAKLKIIGVGDEDFIIKNNVLVAYTGDEANVIVPSGVVEIGGGAFCNNTIVESITLPDGVLKIGDSAFLNCTALENIIIPTDVQSIEDYAFYRCTALTSISTLEHLTSIGMYSFYGCTSLESISLSENLTNIGDYGFSGCTSLESISLSENLTDIGDYGFSECTSLTEIMLPSNLKSISSYVFSGCTSLQNIILPEKLLRIEEGAFRQCSALKEITFPNSLNSIGNRAFSECENMTGNLILPDSIETIGSSAFSNCRKLSGSLKIPTGVTSIENSAFYNCAGFDGALELPAGVTSIGDYAFYSCRGFAGNLKLPAEVTSIGNYAFYNCIGFDGALELPAGVTSIGYYAFYNCTGFSGTLLLSQNISGLGNNVFAKCESFTDIVIGEGIKNLFGYSLSNSSFSSCYGVHSISFLRTEVPVISGTTTATSSSGTYIKNFFESLSNLETIYVPEGCYNVYSEAWSAYLPSQVTIKESNAADVLIENGVLIAYTGSDTSFTVPDSVTEIGEGAFLNNSTLENIVLPAGLTKIGNAAFRGCTGLTELVVPSGVTSIGSYAFSDCTSLSCIELPNGITSIGSYAFNGCSALSGVDLPDGLVRIEEYTFYGCSSLSNIELADGITSIGAYAFYGCKSLTNFTFPAGITDIGIYSFGNCKGLTSIKLPEGITSIAGGTFFGCSNITGTLVIPNSVTSIDYAAFNGCSGLSEVVFGTGLKNLYGGTSTLTFANCTGIQSLTFLGTEVPIIGNSVTATSSVQSCISRFFSFLNTSGNGNPVVIWVPQGCFRKYKEAYMDSVPSNVRIKETGAEDFLIENGVLTGYLGSEENVVVPNHVTEIGESAFRNNQTVVSVTLPESLTGIGAYAFKDCTSLTELNIPDGVTKIGDYAFYNCCQLTGELVLPSGVTKIGDYTFYQCSSLSGELMIPSGVTKIGAYAFYQCSGLSGELAIPSGITEIGAYTFYQCSGFMGELAIPDGVGSIGDSAFYGCSGFTGMLVIPDTVTTLYGRAFYNCTGFTDVVVGRGVTHLGSYYNSGNYQNAPFAKCSGVKSLVFLGNEAPIINSGVTAASSSGTYIQYAFDTTSMPGLETIYVLPKALEIYQTAWGDYLPGTVAFSTDTLTFPVQNLCAESVSSRSAELSWLPSGSSEVTGYYVYRDGKQIADTAETSFRDTELQSDTTYTYRVTGHTETGEETAPASLTVTTAVPAVNRIYTENGMWKVGVTNSILYAEVTDSGNLESAVGRFYYVDESGNALPVSNALTTWAVSEEGAVYQCVWDITQLEDKDYTVVFKLTDMDGTEGTLSQTITVDHSIPDALSNVVAVGDTNQIVLSWSIAHEITTEKYHIYRRCEDEDKFTLIKRINSRDTLSYTDAKATKDAKYYYYVVAVNDFGQEGPQSALAVAKPSADTEAPRVVKLTPVNGSVIGGNVEFYAQAQDNVAAVRTELYLSTDEGQNWTLLQSIKSNYCRYTLNTADYGDVTVSVKGVAYDAAGNESDALAYKYKIDNTGPEKVTGISYECTATTVTLKWNDVADSDFSFFRVEQQAADGTFRKVQDVSTTLGVNLYNLTADTEYTYRVAAYDKVGNRGEASDVITVRTAQDTTAPVITAIKPNANYYNHEISYSVTAKDNTAVASIQIQTSPNAVTWTDEKLYTFAGNRQTETAEGVLLLDAFAEGNLYIRGVARDTAGNESDTMSTAPYVQYVVDRTAPAVPKNLNLNVSTGAMELTWDMGTEEDLEDYILYRSKDGVSYTQLISGLRSVNYWDRSVEKGITYFYKLAVRDTAGNVSVQTEAVQGILPDDTEAPVIQNYVPLNGSTIGVSNSSFRVMVSDNWKVRNVKVTYTVNEDTEEAILLTQEINNYYANLNAAIPVSRMNDGDILHLKVVVTDAQGLETSAEDITYTVDKTAPRVNTVSAEGDEEKITIRWQGNGETDLAGYRIYRKTESGSYAMIAQRSAQEGTEYFYEDYNAEPKATYNYKVEAVDKYGNTHAKESDSVWLNVSPKVTAALNVEAAQEVNVEYFFDGSASFADLGIRDFAFDFGDGTTESGIKAKVIHSYTSAGTYEVTLRVTDTEGQTAEVTRTVTVEEAKLLGTVKVKAVDGNGNPLAGIPVYFDLDQTSENAKYSDVKGYASFVAGAGQYSIGAYKNGYLPAKRTVIVRANSETEIVMTMVEEPIVTGEFEVDRMTLDEIKAAGIDVTKPANQQVVNMKIHLTYGTTPITMNVITNGKDIYSDGTVIVDTDEGTRKLTPTVIDISGANGEDYTGSDGENVILAIMDVPVEASYLKEFFDVKLHIVNNASKEFELTSNVVTLNVPEGMSLVEGVDSSSSGTVQFDSLKGQEEKTIGWILRGDTAGEYNLEADYSAILSQFSAPVKAVFKTDTPITVYGMDAVKLIADINQSISYGGFYFNLSMQNIGGADMYLPTIDVMDGIVTAYQEAEEGAGKKVKTLSSMIKNASGYSRYLSAEEAVSKLSVGETYTKKYACYDTISTDDIAHLLDAVYEMAEGLNIQVEINMTDIDLYSIDSAKEKAESFYTDAQKADIYGYFIDSQNENFYYYINALKDDKDFVKKLGELLYRTADCALNLDMDLFTDQNMKDITRKYIYEMLMDETFLDATETKVDDTYLRALKSVIPKITGALAQREDLTEEMQQAFAEALGEKDNMRSLALALKQGGKDGFWKKLQEIAELVDGSMAEALEESVGASVVSGWCGSALGSLLEEMSGVLGTIDRELEAWYESAELTNQLVTINAAQYEAKTLLQFILNHPEIHPVVYEEIETIFRGLEEGFKTQEEAFNEEFAKLEAQADLNARVEQLLNTKYYSFGFWGAGTVLAALKLMFNDLDDMFGWEESVNAAQSLQAAASITYALRSENVSLRNSGDAEKFLRALKYLIKIRLVGEKTYINLTKEYDGEKGLLASINRGQRANYKSLDEYYSIFRTRILTYRDILFGDVASRDGIPAAPAVTIDYGEECTLQSFDFAYEYSFDGVDWTACDGSRISLNPGTAGCHLWVRMKESQENLAGNSTKIYVPARPGLSEEVSVKYRNGVYLVEGLDEGTYYYQFAGQEIEEVTKELSFIQEKDAVTELQAEEVYGYMAIAAAATEKAFAGRTKNIRVQKACTVILKNDETRGKVQGAGEYFQGELANMSVIVNDGYRFLGWYQDEILLSEETEYSFTVAEDVEIEARYELAKRIPVTFCGWKSSVLTTEYYSAGLSDAAEIRTPGAPVPDGYRFAGWTLDGTVYQAAEIQQAVLEKFASADEIAVYAKFEQKEDKYTVTVQNGTLTNGMTSGLYRVSSGVTVHANEPESGKKFAYWMKDGVIVGYAESYSFYMPTRDTALTAVYEDEVVEIKKVATTHVENVTPDVENAKISFVSISMVPQDCSIVYAGIVATSDISKVTGGAELTAANADYVRGNKTSAHNYKYTWTKGKVVENQNWYVRAYLKYADEDGTEHEIYGDLVTANLSGIVK